MTNAVNAVYDSAANTTHRPSSWRKWLRKGFLCIQCTRSSGERAIAASTPISALITPTVTVELSHQLVYRWHLCGVAPACTRTNQRRGGRHALQHAVQALSAPAPADNVLELFPDIFLLHGQFHHAPAFLGRRCNTPQSGASYPATTIHTERCTRQARAQIHEAPSHTRTHTHQHAPRCSWP